ncbi:5675_t:CDS:1, partial [Ambispora gerdemannii]
CSTIPSVPGPLTPITFLPPSSTLKEPTLFSCARNAKFPTSAFPSKTTSLLESGIAKVIAKIDRINKVTKEIFEVYMAIYRY